MPKPPIVLVWRAALPTTREPAAQCGRGACWLVMVAALLTSSGCARVAPYERARLAHPTMDPHDAESSAYTHVLAVQEGAIGGGQGSGVGCGCD